MIKSRIGFHLICIATLATVMSCSQKRGILISTQKVAPNAAIAIIVDHPNNIKNVIVATFMAKGFRVIAFNVSDLYSLSDVFDIRDFKKVSFNTSLQDEKSLLSMEKTYDNIYHHHFWVPTEVYSNIEYRSRLNNARTLNEVEEIINEYNKNKRKEMKQKQPDEKKHWWNKL